LGTASQNSAAQNGAGQFQPVTAGNFFYGFVGHFYFLLVNLRRQMIQLSGTDFDRFLFSATSWGTL
jgi:hypothetical protein